MISSVHKRSAEDALIILACDGVWDVMSNVDAVMFLQDIVMNDPNGAAQAAAYEKLSISQPTKSRKKGESDSADSKNRGAKKENDSCTAQMMAEALVDVSLSAGSTDNISAVIVKF
jgi:serine/threonine protein phosphatase PrpC